MRRGGSGRVSSPTTDYHHRLGGGPHWVGRIGRPLVYYGRLDPLAALTRLDYKAQHELDSA